MASPTTTIRVDRETHDRLVELGAAGGLSLMDTVRAATDALQRQRFANQVTTELDALRADDASWADYLADAEATHLHDGLA